MIKAQAKIVGEIAQGAVVRQTKDGGEFLSFLVKTVVPPARKVGEGLTVFVSVTTDGTSDDAAMYAAGMRIEAEGVLSFRKSANRLFLNFKAQAVSASDAEDKIEGVLEFKGTVGKDIESKLSPKGVKYFSFSAFSTEKIGEEFQFAWVRFVKFDADAPEFLVPKAKVEAKGVLEVTGYNASVSLSCRLDEVKPWERQPFVAGNDSNGVDNSMPF